MIFVRCSNCGRKVRLHEGEVLVGCEEETESQHVVEGCDGKFFRVKEEEEERS